jgi:uncharacterized membrane protein YfcA
MILAVGLVIGAILGLTGAGGAAFALPLLVLVIGLPVQQAIGLSLATVALSAGYGAMLRLRSGDIFWWAVGLLSLGGVLAAPLGKYAATFVPDAWLLTGFTLLSMGMAAHMWRRCQTASTSPSAIDQESSQTGSRPWFSYAENGQFQPEARSIGALAVSGLGVGSLSGLFGVGGGFLVVPFLHLLAGVSMRQAMASSLLIITMISSAGFAMHTLIAPSVDWALLSQLGLGATVGMYGGGRVATHCSPTLLQKLFAVALLLLAICTLAKVMIGGL